MAALKRHPPYLIVFCVVLLNYLLCSAILLRGSTKDYPYVEALMAFSAVIALITVWAVESQSTRGRRVDEYRATIEQRDREIGDLKHALQAADAQDINITDPRIAECIKKTVHNVREALKFGNDVFNGEIWSRLGKTLKDSEAWERGDLLTDAANYERILHSFYRRATKDVFATCNDEYLKFWNTPQCKHVLQAHEEAYNRNGSLVTRVFMFPKFDDIGPDDLAIIQNHCRPRYIIGKIFIFDETPAALGSSLFKDFVIVDGHTDHQAIGVTSAFEVGAMAAKWMVDSDAEIEQAAQFIRDHMCDVAEIERRIGDAGA